jgi:serine/threonine-protein kinase
MSKTASILVVSLVLVIANAGCRPLIQTPFKTPFLPTQTPRFGSTFVSTTDGMTLLFVPAGEFPMGSVTGLVDEQPQHTVFLDGFWIDETEVTNAMYAGCVQVGACQQPSVTTYYKDSAYSNHPVTYASWVYAKTYCIWAGRRLPTEAEWEKAASWDPVNNEKRVYPWGNIFDCKKGNFADSECDGFTGTAPVRSFPSGVSPYGALDMGGNVWEWVHDAFLETDPMTGKTENYYAISPTSNPQGVDPSVTVYRILRGGAWKNNYGLGRSAYRLWFGLDDSYDFGGFRCAYP